MRTLILLQSSTRTLKKHKIRSLLTILGIMIGIAAIIITFAIGRGAQNAVSDQIMSMGENSLYVIPSALIKHGALRGSNGMTRLRERDIDIIKAQSPEIREISPIHASVQEVEFGGTSLQQNLIGCYPNTPKIQASKLTQGEFFNKHHMKRRSNVAVLSSKPAKALFKNEDPIGKVILINKQPCKVIGVLEKKSHYFGPQDPNERIFIPYTTSKKICPVPGEADDELTALAVQLYSDVDSQVFLRKLRNILRFSHTTSPDVEDPFTILDQQTLEDVAQNAASIIRLFGLIAASISLLVGSIGVMNIMLVAVKERTSEIGLRMAIGATQRLIRLQFLIESTTLCFVGGIIGVLMGIVGQIFIGRATNLSPVTEILPMIISLVVTILIGIFFGYYPAYQASQLNPVDALRER